MLCSSSKIHLGLSSVQPLLSRKVREKQPRWLSHRQRLGAWEAWLGAGPPPGGGGAVIDSPTETTLLVAGVPKEK